MTNSLKRRIWQHQAKMLQGFTKQYEVDRLVHFEQFRNVTSAIQREKIIKSWTRKRKLALIEAANPSWRDESAGWHQNPLDSSLRSE